MSGPREWAHAEEGKAADFQTFYEWQPRSWIAALSTPNVVQSQTGGYAGTANGFVSIDPLSDVLAFVFEYQGDDGGENYDIKVDLVDGGATRETILNIGLASLTSWTIWRAAKTIGGLATLGDMRGEKGRVELFFRATGSATIDVRNMRVFCGTGINASADYGR